MKLILSSFAFAVPQDRIHKEYFHRMPPISFSNFKHQLEPDYSILFLADEFIVDESMFIEIIKRPELKRYKELLELLKKENRLIVKNFKEIIEPYSNSITSYINNQINEIENWLDPFKELINIWEKFANYLKEKKSFDYWIAYNTVENINTFDDFLMTVGSGMWTGMNIRLIWNLKSYKTLTEYKKNETNRTVSIYLHHILSTIILADELNAEIYDWQDIAPLYRYHFNSFYRPIRNKELVKSDKCSKFFEIMFPDFYPEKIENIAKILDDKRIFELRSLISESVKNKTEFDAEYANKILRNVISQNYKINKMKNIAGWAAKPLSLIPYSNEITDVIIDKSLEYIIEKNIKSQNGWFYLISENY